MQSQTNYVTDLCSYRNAEQVCSASRVVMSLFCEAPLAIGMGTRSSFVEAWLWGTVEINVEMLEYLALLDPEQHWAAMKNQSDSGSWVLGVR